MNEHVRDAAAETAAPAAFGARQAAPEQYIKGALHDWEIVIGMEIHAQVQSNAKLFSGASTEFGMEPNSNVSFVDAAMPGMLPVINEFCVAQAVKTGLGLKAKINLVSAFDRKNYFYPDLPQGYQISQLYHPSGGEGEVIVDMAPAAGRKMSARFQPLPHFRQIRRPMHFSMRTSSRRDRLTASWTSCAASRSSACCTVRGKPSRTKPFSPASLPRSMRRTSSCTHNRRPSAGA